MIFKMHYHLQYLKKGFNNQINQKENKLKPKRQYYLRSIICINFIQVGKEVIVAEKQERKKKQLDQKKNLQNRMREFDRITVRKDSFISVLKDD
ncbi:unnamed protein product [Paramecium sonneborni]|uniref:Uncharacterized protein n=1 Tax=Paramecium sonneborni TaxID=65129 RepID=A0A8S1NDE9_9CILI|nr:unnamed protein product [Paramecium sonneborni]